MSDKKITKVGSSASSDSNEQWKPTEDNRSKATIFRVISIVLWVIAIGFEIWAIIKLKGGDVKENGMTMMIVFIVIALICAVVGNLLWKKANRLDPASKKDKFRFFVQNQLGAIISALAFLPLLIFVLTDKNIDGKQKGILGAIVGVALLVGVGTGMELNPNSKEKEAETQRQEKVLDKLTGKNEVFWTESGKSYHIYNTCGYINGKRTKGIFEGKVADARELKNITDLCDRCANQAEKEKESMSVEDLLEGGEEDEAAE